MTVGSGGRGRLVVGFFKNIDATLNQLDSSDLDCMTGFDFDINIVAELYISPDVPGPVNGRKRLTIDYIHQPWSDIASQHRRDQADEYQVF